MTAPCCDRTEASAMIAMTMTTRRIANTPLSATASRLRRLQRVTPGTAHGREDVRELPLANDDLLEDRQDLDMGHAGEHQGAPGDAQRHTQRRLVGAVARDIADQQVKQAVTGLDDVKEVTAEHTLAA